MQEFNTYKLFTVALTIIAGIISGICAHTTMVTSPSGETLGLFDYSMVISISVVTMSVATYYVFRELAYLDK